MADLLIFDSVPHDRLIEYDLASAVQKTETAFFLATTGYWHSVIPLIWESCEQLLRANCMAFDKNADVVDLSLYSDRSDRASKLQNQYRKYFNVPDRLHSRAHELRKARNKMVHSGYNVWDLDLCIDLLFNAGVPYLMSLMENFFCREFSQLSSRKVFWTTYENTRKVVNSKIRKKMPVSSTDALLFFNNESRRPWPLLNFRVGHHAYSAKKWLIGIDCTPNGPSYGVEEKIRSHYIYHMTKNYRGECICLDQECWICHGEVIANIQRSASGIRNSRPFEVNAFACPECTYLIDDSDVVKYFCDSFISDEERSAIAKRKCQLAVYDEINFDHSREIDGILGLRL